MLREQKLPAQGHWTTALERAGSILGVAVSPLLNASNVSSLVTEVRKKVTAGRQVSQNYCQKLRDRIEKMGLSRTESDRLNTAAATLTLLEKLHHVSDDAVVGVLESAEVMTSESAMGECLTKAGILAGILDGTSWEMFEAIAELTDERKAAATAIRSAVEEAVSCDEHVKSLAGALKEAQSKALRLLTVEKPKLPVIPVPEVPKPTPTLVSPSKPGRKLIDQGSEEFQHVADAREKLEQLGKLAAGGRHIKMTISWQVEEETNS